MQNTATRQVTVRGLAYDTRTPSASIVVRLYVDGKYARRVMTRDDSPGFNRQWHIKGKHKFSITFTWSKSVKSVKLATFRGHWYTLDVLNATHIRTTQADRIISVAKRYVGKARYRDGGASPSQGFDCSGYTKYVFAAATAGTLPHNADAQRRMSRMHRVSASSARPGDLVFYQDGSGHSFHVAIYAGKHKQYAAATVRDGIRYQPIWSSNVVYGRYI